MTRKPLEKKTISVLILSSGANIIANVVHKTDSTLTVLYPMLFGHVRGESGFFAFDRWMYYVEDGEILVNRDQVVAEYKPTDELINAYVEFYSHMVDEKEPPLVLLEENEDSDGRTYN